jgi:hypothetical protein
LTSTWREMIVTTATMPIVVAIPRASAAKTHILLDCRARPQRAADLAGRRAHGHLDGCRGHRCHIYGSMALVADGWLAHVHACRRVDGCDPRLPFCATALHDPRFAIGTGKLGELILTLTAFLIGYESLVWLAQSGGHQLQRRQLR